MTTERPMSGLYLYEFLFRGRGPDDERAPDYHVILAEDHVSSLGVRSTSVSGALTPDQAAGHGFGLPAILDGISREALAEVERLRATVAGHEATLAERDAAIQGHEAAASAHNDVVAAHVAQIDALQDTVQALQSQLGAVPA